MQWEKTVILLTMYTLFLKMLFVGTRNAHSQGLNMVHSQLVSMASIKHLLNPHYYVDMVWAVLNHDVKHFNQCMAMDTLQYRERHQLRVYDRARISINSSC